MPKVSRKDIQRRLDELRLEVVRNEQAKRAARSSLLGFTCFTKRDFEVNWHHRTICDAVERWAFGDIKRLIICLPPRHSKTEIVSRRLPPYLFGRAPNSRIIATSYSQELSNAISGDVAEIMQTPEYVRLFRVFRSQRKKKTIREWHIARARGYYLCAGVRGGITGRGFTHGIIDDPIKNLSEAMSQRHRDALWQWYWAVFFTRRAPDARILITTTRWHLDDLVGRLLDRGEEDWHVLSFEAERTEDSGQSTFEDPREQGEYLWPDRFDADSLAPLKKLPHVWNAAYQQRPTSKSGGIVKRAWFNRYDHAPGDWSRIVISLDCRFTDLDTGSDVALQVWAQRRHPHQAEFYLLEEVAEPFGFMDTLNWLLKMVRWWQPVAKRARARFEILIEDKANGPAVINTLKRKVPGIIPYTPRESKHARFIAQSPAYAGRCVFVPTAEYLVQGARPASAWVEDHIDQLVDFPFAAKNDKVDAASQALDHLVDKAFELLIGRPDILEPEEQTGNANERRRKPFELMIGGPR